MIPLDALLGIILVGTIREVIDFDNDPAMRAVMELENALEKHADRLENAFERSRGSGKKAVQAIDDLGQRHQRLGRIIDISIGNIAAQAFQKFIAILRQAPKFLASVARHTAGLVETQSKYLTVFGRSTSITNDYVRSQSALLGLTQSQTKGLLATTGAILQGAGFTKLASAEMSVAIARLAGDLASFNNVPIGETFGALQAALTGERERLKSLGIVLNEAEVQQLALARSTKTAASELSQQEKAAASLDLIMRKAGSAVGDLERTQQSAANQMRRAEAQVLELRDVFEDGLAPAIDEIASSLAELTGDEGMKEFVRSMGEDVGVAIQKAIQFLRDHRGEIKENIDEITTLISTIGESITELDAWRQAINNVLGSEDEGLLSLAGWLDKTEKTTSNITSTLRLLREGLGSIVDLGDRATPHSPLADPQTNIPKGFMRAPGGGIMRIPRQTSTGGTDVDDDEEKVGRGAAKALAQARRALQKITEARQAAVAFTTEQREALADVLRLQERISRLKEIGQRLGAKSVAKELDLHQELLTDAQARLRNANEFANAIRRAARDFNGLEPRGIVRDIDDPDQIREILTSYNEQVTELQNQLSIGTITQEEFFRAVGEASNALLVRLRSLFDWLSKLGLLTPELQKLFRELFDAAEEGAKDAKKGIEDLGKGAEKLGLSLSDIASALRSITRFADVFGDINEDVRQTIDGIADVLDNMERLQRVRKTLSSEDGPGLGSVAGIAAQSVSVIGIAAGVGSILAGFIGALRDQSEIEQAEMMRLREALKENARRVSEAIDRLIRSGRIGPDVTGEAAQEAERLLQVFDQATDAAWQRFLENPEDIFGFRGAQIHAFRQLLQGLEDLGIPEFQSLVELFESLQATGMDAVEAIGMMMAGFEDFPTGLRELITTLSEGVGGFGDSVAGAIAQMRFFEQFLGGDLPGALDRFLAFLLENVEEIGPELRALLNKASGLDITTEEGRVRLREIVRIIATSIPDFLGGLTTDELEDVLEELLRFAEGLGVTGGDSTSAVFQRSITEVQANEISAWLEEIAFYARNIFQLLGGTAVPPIAGGTAPAFGGAGPFMARPPLSEFSLQAADFIRPSISTSRFAVVDGLPGATVDVDVGGVTVPLTLSRAQIDQLVEEVGSQVMVRLDEEITRHQNQAF